MKITQLVLALWVALLVAGYGYWKCVGVSITAPSNVFVMPVAMTLPNDMGNDQVELHLDITPVAWIPEAAGIYQLASLNIPVRVLLTEDSRRKYFINGIDAKKNLIVVCSKEDAKYLLSVLGTN